MALQPIDELSLRAKPGMIAAYRLREIHRLRTERMSAPSGCLRVSSERDVGERCGVLGGRGTPRAGASSRSSDR